MNYIFSGPGLVSFPRFVTNCLEDNMPACDNIIGEDLDINSNLVLDYSPFLDAFEAAFPDGQLQPRLLFETSRGCWWGERATCAFCGLNGPSICFRAMKPEIARNHIESLLEYGSRCDFFASVDNIMPREYLAEVFPHVRMPPSHKMQYEIRADLADDEIDTLCKAGVTLVQPGIESLSTATLKLMRKGTTAFSNISFLKACARHPISMVWSLLLFTPGEDENTYEKYLLDIPKLAHLHPPYAAYPVEFVRYAHYFESPEAHGLDLRPEPFYSLIYPYDDESITHLAYKFCDANADTEKMRHWLGTLNDRIESWRTRWLNTDNRLQARLCLLEENGQSVVYDSRSGEAIEHTLSANTEKVLRILEEPLGPEDVAGKLRDVPDLDAAGELAYLNERNLLFEEGGRYLSLVIL